VFRSPSDKELEGTGPRYTRMGCVLRTGESAARPLRGAETASRLPLTPPSSSPAHINVSEWKGCCVSAGEEDTPKGARAGFARAFLPDLPSLTKQYERSRESRVGLRRFLLPFSSLSHGSLCASRPLRVPTGWPSASLDPPRRRASSIAAGGGDKRKMSGTSSRMVLVVLPP
jgi:hypothetical protein